MGWNETLTAQFLGKIEDWLTDVTDNRHPIIKGFVIILATIIGFGGLILLLWLGWLLYDLIAMGVLILLELANWLGRQ